MNKIAKTTVAKNDESSKKWVVIDAQDQILGRMAVQIANILRGKNKATYTPHLDTGDFVVVINAEKVKVTGRKEESKIYQRYSGFMSGRKEESLSSVRAKYPERIIESAVKGMIPRNRLGRQILKKLKVYKGSSHPHTAQSPEQLTLRGV